MPQLTTLPWFGGKHPDGAGLCQHIISLLPPPTASQTYIEPFAGMLGVLLARQPAGTEVINDLDGNVANYWQVLRDRNDELAALLNATPYCRQTFKLARQRLHSDYYADDNVGRAWAFVVSVAQSVGGFTHGSGWSRGRARGVNRARTWRNRVAGITSEAMKERLRGLTIECQDACEVIDFYGTNSHAVIYCDPPYTQGAYGYLTSVNQSELMASLLAAKARIAISGYDNCPWHALGWQRHTFATLTRAAGHGVFERTEVVWTNYDAHNIKPQQELAL